MTHVTTLVLAFLVAVLALAGYYLRNRYARDRRRAEATLRQSEERFRLLVSGVRDYAILMLDAEGRVVSWNEGAERIKGYGREEIIGQHFSRFYPPEDLESGKPARALERAAGEGRFEDEGWRVRKDGSRFWASGTITALRDEAGRLRGFAKITRDITERKRAEEALGTWERIFQYAGWGVALSNPATHVLEAVNPAFASMHGYTVEELVGRPLEDTFAPESKPEFVNHVRSAHEKGHHIYESIHVRKDGTRFPVLTDVMVIKDQDGRVLCRAANFQDISERKRAEEALRESDEQVRLLLESTAQGLYGLDIHGNCTFCNPACLRMLGYNDPWRLLGHNMHALIHHSAADGTPLPQEACRIYQTFRAGEGSHDDNEKFWRADGTSFPVEYWSRPVWRDGKIVGAVVTFWDITDRVRVDELERRTSDITLLSELGSLLQTCITAEEAYAVIGQSAQKLFRTESGAVFVLNAPRSFVEAVADWGDSLCSEKVFAPDDCWALRSGRLHFVDDLKSPLRCRHLAQPPDTSYLCVPMMAQGEALGILYLQAGEVGQGAAGPKDGLSASKQQLATTVAEQIGLALANLRLRETLQTQSIRDSLTGLFNRRYMEESFDRELRRAARNRRPLGAIMLDLDHFKLCNDTFGHEAGDVLLREIGSFLQTHIRKGDVACRYGGEEFLVILPDASLEVTRQRAERLREGAKRLRVRYSGRSLGRITLSLGAAVFPEHGSSVEALLKAADDALYEAKRQGRDRVAVCSVEPSPIPHADPQ